VASGSRRRILSIIVAVIAVLGIFLALNSALSSGDGSAASFETAKAAAAAGKPSGAFTGRTLDGATVDVPGSRPSALFFFSTHCASCGPGAQAVAEAKKNNAVKANFVAVNINPDDTVDDIRSFLRDNQAAGLAFIRDTDTRLIQAYQVKQLSTAVILNASGGVVFRAVDPTAAQIRSELTKLSAR